MKWKISTIENNLRKQANFSTKANFYDSSVAFVERFHCIFSTKGNVGYFRTSFV